MTETRITPQDFQPAQQPKRKWGQLATYSGTSTSFLSPNQFAVLSDSEPEEEEEEEEEENKIPSKSRDNKTRIPPIVIYSLLETVHLLSNG
jgi:hypothetical protein